MAFSFRQLSWPFQFLVFVLVAGGVFAAGTYVPGPVLHRREQLAAEQARANQLASEARTLQSFEQQETELKRAIQADRQELVMLEQALPQHKDVDTFILQLEQAATLANVSIRRVTAKAIVEHEYHTELPFEIVVDGPYYSIEDFFQRLSQMPRLTNIEDLNFTTISKAGGQYKTGPGTTVSGTFTVVTYFAQGAGPAPAKKAPGKR
jgi:type IV pilus assembly protein PilO